MSDALLSLFLSLRRCLIHSRFMCVQLSIQQRGKEQVQPPRDGGKHIHSIENQQEPQKKQQKKHGWLCHTIIVTVHLELICTCDVFSFL